MAVNALVRARPRSGASELSRRRGVSLLKPLEQLGELFGGHADAGVAHGEAKAIVDPTRDRKRNGGRFR